MDRQHENVANHSGEPGVLHAYDAEDVSKELYSSEQNSDRDRSGISVRFTIPSVINGRVYVGARNEVDVYGLLQVINGLH